MKGGEKQQVSVISEIRKLKYRSGRDVLNTTLCDKVCQ